MPSQQTTSRGAARAKHGGWLELQWYMFAILVMFGASYTFKRNEHVRVEIFYLPPVDFSTPEKPQQRLQRTSEPHPEVEPANSGRRSARRIFPHKINKLPIDGGAARWNGMIALC